MNEVKSGLRTSEFWLAILPYVGQLVVVVLYALGMIDQETFLWLMGSGFLGGSFASGKYSQSRAEVKTWGSSQPMLNATVSQDDTVG